MPGDVTNKDDLKRIAKEIGDKEGGIHIVRFSRPIFDLVAAADVLVCFSYL